MMGNNKRKPNRQRNEKEKLQKKNKKFMTEIMLVYSSPIRTMSIRYHSKYVYRFEIYRE